MEPNNEMKNKVDQTANLEEAKDVIAQAGMLLTDDEVGEVAGAASAGNLVFQGKGDAPAPNRLDGRGKPPKLIL